MADIFSSHPYPGRKEINPASHFCETCEKTIAYKDRMAHERGKKHKQLIQALTKSSGDADGTNDLQPEHKAGNGTGCHNCGGPHMARDCSEPRPDNRECHNCKRTGHISKECPEPRQVTCRNCLEVGHMSKDCDQPRSAANVTCNNCDTLGHFAKDCPEPKNWSKVTCHNCQLTGHTSKRCTAEPATDMGGDIPPVAAEGDWMNDPTVPAIEGDWANGDTSAATATADAATGWGNDDDTTITAEVIW